MSVQTTKIWNNKQLRHFTPIIRFKFRDEITYNSSATLDKFVKEYSTLQNKRFYPVEAMYVLNTKLVKYDEFNQNLPLVSRSQLNLSMREGEEEFLNSVK